MRKSQILISSWFRGNMVPVTPKVPSPHSNMRVGSGRGGSGGRVFLTGPLFSTAKETLWEDKGISIVDPGFCARVEGNWKGEKHSLPTHGSLPTCGSFWIVSAAGGRSSRKQVLLKPGTQHSATACLRLGASGCAPCVSGSVVHAGKVRIHVRLCLLLRVPS